jgi:segregation and condensation protein B
MSLKAKIEAVIYASEDPVTLPQLMGLLGEEAQSELDARAAEQPSLELEPGEVDAAGDDAKPPDAAVEAALAEGGTTRDENAAAVAAEAKAQERKLRAYFREVLDGLMAEYANGDRGIEVREVAGGFRLATKPEYHDAVRGFVKQLKPPLKLSLPALETLAVIAYKQPVTAPEISEIRGVDTGGVLGSLLARKLIQTAGRKPVIGRPMLYKTSKDFLLRFGLKDVNELPSIEEFERMASELNEAVQEEIPMADDGGRHSGEEADAGDETPLDETGSIPEPARTVHESADAIVGDNESEGTDGVKNEASAEVEPMAGVHEAQADGVPEEDDGAA